MMGGIRILTLADVDAFRTFRLTALETDSRFLGRTRESELALPYETWQLRVTPTDKTVCFGMFLDDVLVGTSRIQPWDEDPSGNTAAWKGGYVIPSQRGKGLGSNLYRSLYDWTAEHYPRAVVYIHAENEQSTKMVLKLGAQYMFQREEKRPGLEQARMNFYEIRFPHYARPTG